MRALLDELVAEILVRVGLHRVEPAHPGRIRNEGRKLRLIVDEEQTGPRHDWGFSVQKALHASTVLPRRNQTQETAY